MFWASLQLLNHLCPDCPINFEDKPVSVTQWIPRSCCRKRGQHAWGRRASPLRDELFNFVDDVAGADAVAVEGLLPLAPVRGLRHGGPVDPHPPPIHFPPYPHAPPPLAAVGLH